MFDKRRKGNFFIRDSEIHKWWGHLKEERETRERNRSGKGGRRGERLTLA
jgi:hypothetical protein